MDPNREQKLWDLQKQDTVFAARMIANWLVLERVLLKMMGSKDASADELRAMAKTASRYFEAKPETLLDQK